MNDEYNNTINNYKLENEDYKQGYNEGLVESLKISRDDGYKEGIKDGISYGYYIGYLGNLKTFVQSELHSLNIEDKKNSQLSEYYKILSIINNKFNSLYTININVLNYNDKNISFYYNTYKLVTSLLNKLDEIKYK